MAGTIVEVSGGLFTGGRVSMESGLDGRNNFFLSILEPIGLDVSMESGLDGRNNGDARMAIAGINASQWSPA